MTRSEGARFRSWPSGADEQIQGVGGRMSTHKPEADNAEATEAEDPEVIQRLAEALEDTEAGEAPVIELNPDAASSAPGLPQRGR